MSGKPLKSKISVNLIDCGFAAIKKDPSQEHFCFPEGVSLLVSYSFKLLVFTVIFVIGVAFLTVLVVAISVLA